MGLFKKNNESNIEELKEFEEQYNSVMKYSKKVMSMTLEDPEDFDEDELYGLGLTMMKKALDLSDAAMNLMKWQCETLKSIDDRLKKLENK